MNFELPGRQRWRQIGEVKAEVEARAQARYEQEPAADEAKRARRHFFTGLTHSTASSSG